MYHANYQQNKDGTWKTPSLAFALIGADVNNSPLPAMQNNLYRLQHLNWSYAAHECKNLDEARFQIDLLRMGHYRGMNVAVPYTSLAVQEADYASPLVRASGFSNVIVREQSHICAYNTYGLGAIYSIERQANISISGSSVCIFGDGKLACAIAAAAIQKQASEVIIISENTRTFDYAIEDICDAFPNNEEKLKLAIYGDAQTIIPFCDVIIFAQEHVGLSTMESLCDAYTFNPAQVVMDTYLSPCNTNSLENAKVTSVKFINGMEMYVEAAALSVKIWADVLGMNFEPDRSALRTVLKSMV